MLKSDKPNILVIWGDDIGISNLSCYSRGLMGYLDDYMPRPQRKAVTPNNDRIYGVGLGPGSLERVR
jgi:arylsulfatase A-like enzyme